MNRAALLLGLSVSLLACTDGEPPTADSEGVAPGAGLDQAAQREFEAEMRRIAGFAASVDSVFRPLPLLAPSEEAALRRFPNATQLARARALGVPRGGGDSGIEPLIEEGRLVRLADSTSHWIVRELDHSVPYVVPDVEVLLTEIGERFGDRLEELGSPRFRLEVTSVLRTPESQAELRETNINAARGASTHEFGTTLDVAYHAYAAPDPLPIDIRLPRASWLEPFAEQFAISTLETVAARRSRELQAILGEVLIEMQREGKVMVTLERRQPVYHMTVARRLANE